MSTTRTDAVESHESTESAERVDLEGDNDPEENLEEEFEYEEVEEEIEVEEEEDEEEDEENHAEIIVEEDEEKKKHDELLSLPPHGSEVYLGGIPTHVSEKDLKSLCESIGEVTEVRIMREKESGDGKGYAFVTFRTKELANEAIVELNNREFKGKRIKCSTTQTKHRLFIGNVPRSWSEADVKRSVNRTSPGVQNIELPKDPLNMNRNRGFAFIEYYNHACAEFAKQNMSNPRFKLDDNAPTVSWAESRNGGDPSALQVKALYIKNLPRDITQERLKKLFEKHGKITKVAIPPAKPGKEDSRYGFVHYAERTSVMKALKNTEIYEIDGHVLECSLAKPQNDQKGNVVENVQKSQLQPHYPSLLGYGLTPGPFAPLGLGLGASPFYQPLMNAQGGHAPGGMAMTPIMLPDGRIGYVLQQPGLGSIPHHQHQQRPLPQSKGNRGSSSGRHNNENNRGRNQRYNPY